MQKYAPDVSSKLDKFFDTFVVECKSYAKVDFYPPFNKTLTTWFDQLIREKENTGKKALLIVKANNRKILYCSEEKIEGKSLQLTTTYKDLTLYCYLFDEITS